MTMDKKTRLRGNEAGSALVFALIAMTAALAIGASAMYVALGSRRIANRSFHSKSAFFCAELALERARPIIKANWADRNTALVTTTPPAWYTAPPLANPSGTPPGILCPGPGGYYYVVTIEDDVDEFGTTTQNAEHDSNDQIVVNAEVFAPFSNALQARVTQVMGRDLPPVRGY